MSIAIVLGSARKDGNTRKVIEFVRQHVEADLYDLNDYEIGFYDYDYGQDDDYLPLLEKLVEYDTLILATPVYWYCMSAQMKTFFDRLTDLFNIREDLFAKIKSVKMMALSVGPDGDVPAYFPEPFQATAKYMGMGFGGYVHAWIEKGELAPSRVEPVREWLQPLQA